MASSCLGDRKQVQDARFDSHLTGVKKESFYWRTKTIAHNKGCIPFSQSKSGFCDRKFNFLFHLGLNQSKIAIRTIYLSTWIVQICISIWFQIFVPFNGTAFRSRKRARSLINTAGQGQLSQVIFYSFVVLCR